MTHGARSLAEGNPTDVTAIIVTYNSAHDVETLLDSLPAAFGDVRYDVVVVDNGSSDETVQILRRRSDCLVIPSTNRGFAAGVNEGARHSRATRALLVLNPDAELYPRAVPLMLDALRPTVGIVAPLVEEADGTLSQSLRREPSLLRAGNLSFTGLATFSERISDPAAYGYGHAVDWAMGAVLLIARECFDAVGGLDESFFLYSEETDFCLRARDRGWLTYFTPHARAKHVGGGSGESDETYAMRVLNRVRFFRRRHGTASALVYYLLVLVAEVRWSMSGHPRAGAAVRALLYPSRRPPEIACGRGLLP